MPTAAERRLSRCARAAAEAVTAVALASICLGLLGVVAEHHDAAAEPRAATVQPPRAHGVGRPLPSAWSAAGKLDGLGLGVASP